ncbi:unnamed protein product [Sphenostylis stenocarpa]|uniref:Uncharacterized protein n=1 Tax=Sphenostylis stenocarpa TaxID=92480 RepID=A0AA86SGY8_9FABA|nr:unnamed protein product [Sphenostylis stenocarpa]
MGRWGSAIQPLVRGITFCKLNHEGGQGLYLERKRKGNTEQFFLSFMIGIHAQIRENDNNIVTESKASTHVDTFAPRMQHPM